MGITRKQARIAIKNKLSIQEIQKQFDENFTEMHMRSLYNYAYNYDIPSFELYGINVNYDTDSDYPDKMQVDIIHKPIANGELTDYDMVVSKYDILDAFVNETSLIELLVNEYYKFKNGLSCEKKEDESEDDLTNDDSDECCECNCCECNVSDSESEEISIKKLNQLIDLCIEETKQESKELIKIKELENKIEQLENRIAQLETFRRVGF